MKKPDEYKILEQAHEAAGIHMMQASPRADELISCLEGEIAKRDARIAEHWKDRGCDVITEPLMAVAQHTRIVAALQADAVEWDAMMQKLGTENQQLRDQVAALQARAVVMPERFNRQSFPSVLSGQAEAYAAIANAVLDEVARLNSKGGV